MRRFKVIRQRVGDYRLQYHLARGFLYVNLFPNTERYKARVKIPAIAYRRLAALVSLVTRILMHTGQGAFRHGEYRDFKLDFCTDKF